jgi:hypothetical protein
MHGYLAQFQYFPQRVDPRRAVPISTNRNPQELLNARRFEVAHDDAALPCRQRRLFDVVPRMADEDETTRRIRLDLFAKYKMQKDMMVIVNYAYRCS